jgi:hypothetical protein
MVGVEVSSKSMYASRCCGTRNVNIPLISKTTISVLSMMDGEAEDFYEMLRMYCYTEVLTVDEVFRLLRSG